MDQFELFLAIALLTPVRVCPNCIEDAPSKSLKFHLVEKCHRSKLSVVTRVNASLVDCQRLGFEKKALALNFSPPEVTSSEAVPSSCEVLKCPEADGGLSLVNDTQYDYYSMYAKFLPSVDATCVPGLGMLLLLPRANFSSASAQCANSSGALAALVSEARTDALAQQLAGAGVYEAFVGLRSENGSDFVGVNGETFECSTYRAWAPGHPRRRRLTHDCVTVTRNRTWRTVPCAARQRALCELSPSGPYRRRGAIFKSRINESTTEAPTPNKEREGISKMDEDFEYDDNFYQQP